MTDERGVPVLDERGREEVLADVRRLAPYYTPEWDATTEDAGTAVLELFATLADGVVGRLNRTPEKHRVAFFDALGFGREPPQSARLPLSFAVTDGAGANVPIPAGTRAGAPADDGSELTFEVGESDAFEATPANLERVYSVDPAADRLFDHRTVLADGVEADLLSGDDVQEHALYVGHADAFSVPPGSALFLRFDTRLDGELFWGLEWAYYGVRRTDSETEETGWHRLRVEAVTADDDGVTVKTRLPGTAVELSEFEVNGTENRWVRCRLPPDLPRAELPEGAFEADVRSVRLGTEPRVVAPDALLSNDVPLSVPPLPDPDAVVTTPSSESVLPFGEQPRPTDTFYVGSEPAFTKRGTRVEVRVDGANNAVQADVTAEVTWQYWDGSAWARIDGMEYLDDVTGWRPVERAVGPSVVKLTVGGRLRFTVPEDLSPTAVSGHEGHWIRARFVEGDFGAVTYVRSTPADQQPTDPVEREQWSVSLGDVSVPRLTGVSVEYGFEPAIRPQSAFTSNNGSYGADVAASPPERIRLFTPPDDDTQTLYLGFDRPLRGGPVQLYLPTVDREYPSDFRPRVRWEASGADGTWVPVDVRDGTEGFTRTGIVSAVFADPTAERSLFGERFHWLRARITEAAFDAPAPEWEPPPDRTPDVRLTVGRQNTVTETVEATLRNAGRRTLDLSGYRFDFGFGAPAEATGRISAGTTLAPGEEIDIVGTGRTGTDSVPERDGRRRLVFRFDTLDIPDVPIALLTPDEKFVVGATVGLFGGPRWFGGRSGRDRGTDRGRPTDFRSVTSSAVDSVADSLRRDRTVDGEGSDASVDRCERVLDTEPAAGSPVETPPTFRGVHPNTGWARNVRTVTGEIVGSSDGGPTQTFTLATSPAFEPSVWVDELAALSRPDREAIESARPDGIERVVGPDGTTRAFWVRWTAVADRRSSGPGDRHYVVDPTAGRIEFGDGTNGAVPPRGRDNVRADYFTGGGVGGNVSAGSVTDLVSSVAFVDEVRNVDPGDGGADAESRASALERAPRALRDRGRAVAAADYERIALAASRRLARAKCIPQLNADGDRAPGWVTVVIVPQSGARRPTPSSSLRRTVRERLSEATPASVTATDPSRLIVRSPSYVEVSVAAEVIAAETTASVSAVESAVSDAVVGFLQPLTGGSEGGGWAFGELPCLADLYALLESVRDVDHVERLSVTFHGADDAVTVDEDATVPRVPADTLVYSGGHEFAVRRVEPPVGGVE